jgi:cell division protein ZipA
MDTLRVSLLIVGVLIIVGIYLYGRRQLDAEDRRIKLAPSVSWSKLFSRLGVLFSGLSLPKVKLPRINIPRIKIPGFKQTSDDDVPPINSETLTDEDLEAVGTIVADRKEILSNADDISLIVELTSEQIAPGGEQLFIPVTIVGRHGHHFTGEGILYAMQECGFDRDESGIFYHEVEDQQGFRQRLLGLANIMEPGTFAEEHLMGTFDTPGLVLYLHLPAPVEAREAFDILIEKGRKLAEVLEGDLCDETRSVLTNQTIGHLKEKVEAYRFKQKMTQLQHHRK